MLKKNLLIIGVLGFLACNDKLYVDQIDRGKFCSYFNIVTGNYVVNGKTQKTASTQINKIQNDKVSIFIQRHHYRFDYIINKLFIAVTKNEKNLDSSYLNNIFCKAISTDSFYNQFASLTSGDRKQKGNKSLSFTIAEVMKVASRSFMCDNIKEKDTAISYHICVGINGIAELETSWEYTVLEAFCFEAIFKNLHNNPKFINNFNSYIKNSSQQNKKHFTSFQTHLNNVKEECYAEMEKDKDLQNALLKYYKNNGDNISFKIE